MEKLKLTEEQRQKVQELELEILLEVDRLCEKHNIRYALAYGTLIGAARHNGFIPWDDDIDIWMLRDDYERFRQICKEELGNRYFYQTHDTDKEYYYLFDKIRMNDTVFKETFLSNHNIHHGIYIDIFPLDYVPDGLKEREKHYKKFRFWRLGLMSKYINIKARSGKKKYQAMLLRLLYLFFPLGFLYKKANQIAIKYNEQTTKSVLCLSSVLRGTYNVEYILNSQKHVFEGHKLQVPDNYDSILKSIYGDYMVMPPEEQRKTVHDLIELKL